MQPTDPLPPNGFFAGECTGRKINPKQTLNYYKGYPKPPKVTVGTSTINTSVRHWPHVPVERQLPPRPKLQKLNSDFSGVTQRDVMNWITNESDTFGDYEKMMLRKIEPKSFIIAMGKAIIRAGYTKSDVKSGRANRWELPSDIIVPAVAKRVEPVTMKKSPLVLRR